MILVALVAAVLAAWAWAGQERPWTVASRAFLGAAIGWSLATAGPELFGPAPWW